MGELTQTGIELIQHFECLHDGDPSTPALEPQLDCRGIPTLGWGAIWDEAGKRVTLQTPAIDRDCADRLFLRDTRRAQLAVMKLITVPLSEGQFDALVSFTYNLGSGQLLGSQLRAVINRQEYDQAPAQFARWVYAGGVKYRGLVLRRQAEIDRWNA